jgi:hypothetical protein
MDEIPFLNADGFSAHWRWTTLFLFTAETRIDLA